MAAINWLDLQEFGFVPIKEETPVDDEPSHQILDQTVVKQESCENGMQEEDSPQALNSNISPEDTTWFTQRNADNWTTSPQEAVNGSSCLDVTSDRESCNCNFRGKCAQMQVKVPMQTLRYDCLISQDSQNITAEDNCKWGKVTGLCDFCYKPLFQLESLATQLHAQNKCHSLNLAKADLFSNTMNHLSEKSNYIGNKQYKSEITSEKSFDHLYNEHAIKRENSYQYETSGDTFSDSCNFNHHTSTYTVCKVFKCEVCGKSYPDKWKLQRHKYTHTGYRPYKCEICGKQFFETWCLRRHNSVHTRHKPYKCEICNKLFFQNFHLKRHKLIHQESNNKNFEGTKSFS